MSEPLSTEELEAQHSDANDVSNSDVQLLRLSVESLMGSQREKQP